VSLTVEAVEKVPKQIPGQDAEKNDVTECATINNLIPGKSQVTPEDIVLTSQNGFSYRLVRLRVDLTGPSPRAILCINQGGMSVVAKVQKWGNSQGLRLAKQVLQEACISIGDFVDVSTREGVIIITPVRRVRGKQSLQELVSRIPKSYRTKEVDWGRPIGREDW
jgi:antitoxin MazE